MNHKQKCFYTALGAAIMLVGMGVGAIVSPPLIAQRNGVLGEIQCTSLTVVNKSGEPAILLRTSELANRVIVRNPLGKEAVRLSAGKVTNRVTVYNPEETNAVQLYADEVTNRVSVHNKVGMIRWEAP